MRWLNRTLLRGPFLTLCLSQKEFDRVVRRLASTRVGREYVNNGKGATTNFIDTTRGLVCIVCVAVPPKTSLIDVHGILVHEAAHVWQAMLRDIGEDDPGNETEAYSLQAIALELFTEYGRRK